MDVKQTEKRKLFTPGLRNLVGLFALTLTALTLFSACSQGLSMDASPNTPKTVTLDASWAEFYPTLKDLKAHSNFAIRGEIAKIDPTIKPADGPVYSMVTVTVKQVLWSAQQRPIPGNVTFEQTGGTYNNVTYQIADDPLFQTKQQVILFFKEYSPGKYRISGGPTGRFSVTNGSVKPVDAEGVQLHTATDEVQFSDQLKNV